MTSAPTLLARCWVCGSSDLQLAKTANIPGPLTSGAFAITDSHYGRTGELHRCPVCGFLQCSGFTDVLQFYEDLRDPDYEDTREMRALQDARLLRIVRRYRPGGRLLDIGAGTGILVEQALRGGYDAVGVEPGEWLQAQAARRGLPVVRGTFPHPDIAGPFDVVTLIDVIEHVPDPVALLSAAGEVLSADGVLVVATPDVGSLCARVLGWRWWHFRVAHIGYFGRTTMTRALTRAGLATVGRHRQGWRFRGDYLLRRLARYVPLGEKVVPATWLARLVVPVNLFDSMIVVARRRRR